MVATKVCHITDAAPACFPSFSIFVLFFPILFVFSIFLPPPPPGYHIDIFILHLKYLNSSVLVPSQETNGSYSSTRASQAVTGQSFSEVLLLPHLLPLVILVELGISASVNMTNLLSLKNPCLNSDLFSINILKAICFFEKSIALLICANTEIYSLFSPFCPSSLGLFTE